MSTTNEGLAPKLDFWEANGKKIITVVSVLVLAIGGYLAYNQFVAKPKIDKAIDAIAKAQQYFAQDSLNLALHGDGQNPGFLKVIEKHSGTPSANIAQLYAGQCYLHLGEYENALKYLNAYNANGSKATQALAYGLIGDANAELQKNEEALSNYKRAAAHFEENEALSAEYLYRAAGMAEVLGKNSEAVELYQQLKDKFPRTEKGFVAEKYLGKLTD